jgi:hypothetical protein
MRQTSKPQKRCGPGSPWFGFATQSRVPFRDNPQAQVKTMREPHPQDIGEERRTPPHAVVYYWGVAILLVGLVGAALIYVFATGEGGADPDGEIASERMYEHNLQLMGGKFAVYVERVNQWFASLWHGRPLAYTIAVLAVAIALACFWVAHLMAVPVRSEADPGREV